MIAVGSGGLCPSNEPQCFPERMRELAQAITDGSGRSGDLRELCNLILGSPKQGPLIDAASRERPFAPGATIRMVKDGNVYRIVDDAGRRYFAERGNLDTWAFWAVERYLHDATEWDRCTAFTYREAFLLCDAIHRERAEAEKAQAMADKLATGLAGFGDTCTAAREWLSRREHG